MHVLAQNFARPYTGPTARQVMIHVAWKYAKLTQSNLFLQLHTIAYELRNYRSPLNTNLIQTCYCMIRRVVNSVTFFKVKSWLFYIAAQLLKHQLLHRDLTRCSLIVNQSLYRRGRSQKCLTTSIWRDKPNWFSCPPLAAFTSHWHTLSWHRFSHKELAIPAYCTRGQTT